MSVSDLKAQLADIPGIQGLTMTTVAGRDNYGFDGLLVSLNPTMGQDDVAAHIRIAVAARKPRPPIVNFTGEYGKAKTAVLHVTGTMANMIKDETAAVMADLGQISNDLTGEA